MKLIIFTPALRASAIGRMACLVTRALVSQGHQVTVVRSEKAELLGKEAHDFGAMVIPWSDFDEITRLANEADALVYQIGDNYDYHRGCMEWLAKFPGIVCLHDYFVGHLFYAWAQNCRQQADETLRRWYGEEVAKRFFSYPSSEEFIEGNRDASPLTEWICSMADGVITHSSWEIERVLNSCPGPVYVSPLAYDASAISASATPVCSPDSNQFTLLTIGHVNPNKRVASVIRAIGSSSVLRQRTVYRLVGYIHPEMVHTLSALARKCQVNLYISGEVDDVTLTHAIQEADVVSCLRWPSLEAASASAIEAMLSGKPTIVTNTGFYREIPDSCVIKIEPDNEINMLRSALELLCEDEEQRRTLAAKAQQWAKATFTADNYAQVLLAMAISTSKSAPVMRAAWHMLETMRQWGASEELKNLDQTVSPLRIFE